jgi:50S ribosomal protein L16 3-hydroxylase
MGKALLGGLSARAFLRDYWHKKPLLVRGAVPGFTGLLDPAGLIEAACRDDVLSRLVTRRGSRWQLRHGPFLRRELNALPARHWSLLVQEVDHFLPGAATLMRAFSFVPLARLDDVMLSLAPPGGGIGAHFDSYDVFLLQGRGRRRWRVSAQTDLELVPEAPLKLLKRFVPEQEWLLEPGDLLYLPPAYAHEGVAVEECVTCSIGFRAPTAQDLGQAFLDYLRDTIDLRGVYRDPDLALQRAPAAIAPSMADQVMGMLDGLRWSRPDVERFLGRFLTEPKPHVFFDPPSAPLPRVQFLACTRRDGVALALKSRMLFDRGHLYLNGELHTPSAPATRILRRLANQGALPPQPSLGAEVADLLYEWYRAGYVELATGSPHKHRRQR